MAMTTYKAFCADVNENPILTQSDEAVQNAVYNWFKYRFIGFEDTDKFLDILQRNVSINYPIYQQKLRIEPGVSNYDWLVTVYRERQLKSTGIGDSTVTYDTKTTGQKIGGGNDVRTGSTDSLKTGGHTTTDTAGLHTTLSETHIGSKTTNDGDFSAWSGDSQVQASLPMSKSYDTFIQPGDDETKKYQAQKAYKGMPTNSNGNLDWSTLSAQAQSGHREYRDDDTSQTTMPVYDDNNTPDKTTTQGDSSNPDISHFEYDANGENTKTTYNSVTDTHSNNETDTGTHTGTDKTENSDSRTDREQVTGRNEDPASLLARATAFIEQSSAFMWFKEQIDGCFYPGFYTETDCDGNEEGSALI